MSANRDAERAHKHAAAAVRRGDLATAERWSKTAERLAAMPRPAEEAVDYEALRAELRRRLALFSEAAEDVERWETEKATYEANFFAALANNLDPPEPLRDNPGGALSGEEYLAAIASAPVRRA